MSIADPAHVHVVIAAYNEAAMIERVILAVRHAGHSVIVVDDGSIDGTSQIAHSAGATVVRHPFNLGQGAALQSGIDFAVMEGAATIVTFDADGQHRPADIARLAGALAEDNADFVLGSRFIGQSPDMPPLRRLLLKAATLFTRITTGLILTDTHNGIRAMTRRGAQALRLHQNRMAHASELLGQIGSSGLRYVERPVTIDYTGYSLAKGQKTSDSIVILLDLFARALYR
jgi:glycosyltransferase involved in cell wall biosynthesis